MNRGLRGAYLARLDLDAPHLAGVSEKVRAQVAALEGMPSKVDLYYCSRGRILKDRQLLKSYGEDAFHRRLVHFILFYRFVAKQLKGKDFVYIRYQGCSLSFLRMLSSIRSSNPDVKIILELPSWPYHTEARTFREKSINLVDRLTRNGLRRYVDRILTFAKQDSILGIPTLRTQNGVDVERLSVRASPGGQESIRLVGVANISIWHGYDRIISGLIEYHRRAGRKQVYFDIVGAGTELGRLQAQAMEGGLEGVVVFHGAASGPRLDAILEGGHIGVSSIGMHRLDVDTSNLKSREYCARGIPFVIGYPDADFPITLPFAFHVPPDDGPVDIMALVEFHDSLKKSHPDISLEMRRYAERNLTWQAKMRPAMDFILNSAAQPGQG